MGKNRMPKRQKVVERKYTEKDLMEAARKGIDSAAKFNIFLTLGSLLLALNEIHHFGKKRLNRIVDRMLEIEFNALTYTEIIDELKARTGVDLRELDEVKYEP